MQINLSKNINASLLKEQLVAANLLFPFVYERLPRLGLHRLTVDAPVGDEAAVQVVVDAHNAEEVSTVQAVVMTAQTITGGADDEARTIPDFVGWTPAQAQDWVQTNVTDLATAKTTLVKMAGMIAAINARVFPRIRAEQQLGG